jgi:anti-anti-sigma regulatory factor
MKKNPDKNNILMSGNEALYDFGPSLHISQIHAHYETLSSLLKSEQEIIVLEGGALEKVDTASLQLIYSFMQAAQKKGIRCHWGSTSSVLLETARLIGFTELLHLS